MIVNQTTDHMIIKVSGPNYAENEWYDLLVVCSSSQKTSNDQYRFNVQRLVDNSRSSATWIHIIMDVWDRKLASAVILDYTEPILTKAVLGPYLQTVYILNSIRITD